MLCSHIPDSILHLLFLCPHPGPVWTTVCGPLASLQSTRLPAPRFKSPLGTPLQNSRSNLPNAFQTSFLNIPQIRLSPSLKMSALSSHQTYLVSKHFHSRSMATQPANTGDRKSPIPNSSFPTVTKSPDLASILVHTLLLPVVSGLMLSCSRMNSPASRSFCLYQPLSFNPFLSFLPQTHFYFLPCLSSSRLQKECVNPSPSQTSSQHFPQSPLSQTTFESTWGCLWGGDGAYMQS